MQIYIFIYILLLISSFFEFVNEKRNSLAFLLIAILIILSISVFRVGIGTDYFSYKEIYNEIVTGHNSTVEIGFTILNFIGHYLGGFKALLFLVTSINLLIYSYILKRLDLNMSLGLMTYYCMFFLNHNFNTMRHGLMASVVWIGFYLFYKRKRIKSVVVIFVGIIFHSLSVIFIPVQYLTIRRLNFPISIIILSTLYLIGVKLSYAFILLNLYLAQYNNKINYYLNDFYSSEIVRYNFGLGFFLYVTIYFTLLYSAKYFKNSNQIHFFNRILFIGICAILLFASVSIFVERIANILIVSLVFIFASTNKIKSDKSIRFIILLLVLSVNLFYLYKILNMPGVNRQYQFIPYQFSLF